MHPFRIPSLLAFAIAMTPAGCSSSDASPNSAPIGGGGAAGSGADAGGGDAASAGGKSNFHEVPATDAYNKDCSTARWGNVSDACWSCMCGACKGLLDQCDADCMGIFTCAAENQTLVNKGTDISCEVRATATACLTTPAAQGNASTLINLDACLIKNTAPGGFRACETECEIPYPGDVCQRFPAAM